MAKQIVLSVGVGGGNLVVDVMTVQFLLNCVPTNEGGPSEELEVDGLAGPLTKGAILRFQHTHFGWADGRVDPEVLGGVTIRKLNEFDPPNSPPITPSHVPHFPGKGFPGKGGKGKGHGKKVTPQGFPEIFFPPTGKGKGRGKKVTGS
jgi:hypothetical protein